jgi:hypothetical protein
MESKYEKYVVREPVCADPVNFMPGITSTRFLNAAEGAIKEANTILSYAWVEKDSPPEIKYRGEPQSHDFDEIFLFMGLNRKDSKDLGAEVELWMGYGKDTEIIRVNTSAMIFVPRGVIHMPLIYKNVKKPLLRIIIGLNVFDKTTKKYPFKELLP